MKLTAVDYDPFEEDVSPVLYEEEINQGTVGALNQEPITSTLSPSADQQPTLTPVDFDPFADEPAGALDESWDPESLRSIGKGTEEIDDEVGYLDIAGSVAKNTIPAFKKQAGGLMEAAGSPSEQFVGAISNLMREVEGDNAWEKSFDYAVKSAAGISGIVTYGPAAFLEQIGGDAVSGIGDAIENKGREISDNATEEIDLINKDLNLNEPEEFWSEDQFKYYLKHGGDAVVNMVPMIATAIATKNPSAGLGLMSTQVYGEDYAQKRQEGFDPKDAHQSAIFNTITEVLPETLPLGIILKEGGSLLKEVFSAGAAEAIQESFTEVAQYLYDRDILDLAEDTLGDLVTRVRDAAILGFGVGGTLKTGTSAVQSFIGSEESIKETDLLKPEETPVTGNTEEDLFREDAALNPKYQGGVDFEQDNTAVPGTEFNEEGELELAPEGEISEEVLPENTIPYEADAPTALDADLETPYETETRTNNYEDGLNYNPESVTTPQEALSTEFPVDENSIDFIPEITDPDISGATAVENAQAEYSQDQRTSKGLEGEKRILRDDFRTALGIIKGEIIEGGGQMGTLIGGEHTSDENTAVGQNGDVTRLASENPEWFQSLNEGLGYQLPISEVKAAIDKALNAEDLGVREARYITGLMDFITGERTDPNNIEASTKTKERARLFRKFGLPKDYEDNYADIAGEIYEEQEYDADWNSESRSMYELYNQAADINQEQADQIFQDVVDDKRAAKELWSIINSGDNQNENIRAEKKNAGEAEGQQAEAEEIESPSTEGFFDQPNQEENEDERQQRNSEQPTRVNEKRQQQSTQPDHGTGTEVRGQQSTGIDEEGQQQTTLTDNDAEGTASIDSAANEAATSPTNNLPEPTEAQIEADNYKKGRLNIAGLNIAIENPRGSTRSGTSPDGKKWETTLTHHYGDIKGTKSADGDAMDVFIGKDESSDKVFIVDQIDPKTGKFDEHKVLLNFANKPKAIHGYKSNYEKGWKGLGNITELSMDEFKTWLKDGDTTEPYVEKPSKNNINSDVKSETTTDNKDSADKKLSVLLKNASLKGEEVTLNTVLDVIISHTKNPFTKLIAKIIRKLNIDIQVNVFTVEEEIEFHRRLTKEQRASGKNVMGAHTKAHNGKPAIIRLNIGAIEKGGVGVVRTIIHEAIHAASTENILNNSEATKAVDSLRKEIIQKLAEEAGVTEKEILENNDNYGLTNVDEFLAELFSNGKFQAILKNIQLKTEGNTESAWDIFLEILRKVLNIPKSQKGYVNALEYAISISESLITGSNVENTKTIGHKESVKSESTIETVEFTGNEFGEIKSIGGLVFKAKIFAKKHFSNKDVINKDDGASINIPWSGIKHALSGTVSKNAAIVSSKLDKIIENAKFIKSEPDKKGRRTVKAIHKYQVNTVIEGEPVTIDIVIRETNEGKKYYDHYEIKKGSPADTGESRSQSIQLPNEPLSVTDNESIAQEKGSEKTTESIITENQQTTDLFEENQENPVEKKADETTDGIKFEIKKQKEVVGKSPKSIGGVILKIRAELRKAGVLKDNIFIDDSGVSNSRYITININEEEQFKIRISDHALPDKYDRSDVHIGKDPVDGFYFENWPLVINKLVNKYSQFKDTEKSKAYREITELKDRLSSAEIKETKERRIKKENANVTAINNLNNNELNELISLVDSAKNKITNRRARDFAYSKGINAFDIFELKNIVQDYQAKSSDEAYLTTVSEKEGSVTKEAPETAISSQNSASETGTQYPSTGQSTSTAITKEDSGESPLANNNLPSSSNQKYDINESLTQKPKSEIDELKDVVKDLAGVVKEAVEVMKPKTETTNKPESSSKSASESKPNQETKPAEKIEDFGEKIGGSRKDVMAYANKLSGDMDVESVPLSKSFPKPDYEKLAADDVDKRILAFIAQIRGEIPARATRYGRKRRAEQIRSARKLANELLSGEVSIDRVVTALNEQENSSYMEYMLDLIAIANDIPVNQIERLGDYKISKIHFGIFNSEREVDKFEVTDASKKSGFGGMQNRKHYDTLEDAVKNLKIQLLGETLNDSLSKTTKSKKTKLDLFQDRKTGELWLGKKIASGKYIELKRFEKGVSTTDARKHEVDHYDELIDKLEKKKKVPFMRKEKNDPRIGKNYREGKNIAPEKFIDTFGFRGVEFGNWVEQGKRQADLNNAYDGLMDLAELLDIPPNAISLNGELGLAFGARGKGGKQPAAAHYESDKVVINLTKKSGSGSLAHEWFHSLDNYFSRMRNRPGEFVTNYPKQRIDQEGNQETSVRPEVLEAYKKVVGAINSTGIPKRSRILDGRRTKDYWSTIVEMTARSFEKFIIDKSANKSEKSDYLANIQSEQYWKVSDAIDQGLVGSDAESVSTYPYPTEEEAKVINAAYQNLFDTLETKETGKGTALFSYAPEDPVVDVARQLSKHDEIFQYPISPSNNMSQIFKDIGQGINVVDNEADKHHDKIWTGFIPQYNTEGEFKKDIPIGIYEKNNKLWINVSALEEGTGGKAIYHAVANYAFNTGKVFIGDPAGLTTLATIRRTEHMLSSALKFGTTRHFAPAAEQLHPNEKPMDLGHEITDPGVLIEPMNWKKGDDAHNIRELIRVSLKNTENDFPQSQDIVYNFDNGLFTDKRTGKSLTNGDLRKISNTARRNGSQTTGGNTLKRAAFFNSLLQKLDDGGMAKLSGKPSQLKRIAKSLRQTFYSQSTITESRPIAGISVSAVEKILAPEKLSIHDNVGLRLKVVADHSGLPDHIKSQIQPGKRVLGVMDEGTVYIVAGNHSTAKEALITFSHEVIGHVGMEKVIGNEWESVADKIKWLHKTGNKRFKKIMNEVHERYGENLNETIEAQEFIAVAVEHQIKDGPVGSLIKKIRAIFRKFLKSLGIHRLFADADLDILIQKSRDYLRTGKGQSNDVVPNKNLFSTGAEQPVYYSAALKAVQNMQQKKGTAQQFIKAMQKAGVKQEEIDWLDIESFMDGKKIVNKDDLVEYISVNQVQVREVIKDDNSGSKKIYEDALEAIERQDNLGYDYPNQALSDVVQEGKDWADVWEVTEDEDIKAIQAYMDDIKKERASRTKFENYQLPGGKNYRELLLTLPVDQALVKERKKLSVIDRDRQLTESEQNRYDELRNLTEKNKFKSSHYDEPNILAHIRFNERTDADGNRVLFLEEIQADKGQRWRKLKKLIAEGKASEAEISEFKVIDSIPFNKTDAWVLLSMKRMIRYAADNGFDSVAWTTGEQQADRYDLSKKIERVRYNIDAKFLVAEDKGMIKVLDQEGVEPEQIQDYIGKEGAKKLLDSERIGAFHELKGEDLKVGGEGMKGFYDNMLPKIVNKYVKKWGGRVGETEIVTQEAEGSRPHPNGNMVEIEKINEAVHSLTITPQMKVAATNGQVLFSQEDDNSVKNSALRKAGLAKDNRSLLERTRGMVADAYNSSKEDFKNRIKEGLFDRFHGIKIAEQKIAGNLPVEQSGYVASRLSTGMSSIMHGILHYGSTEWREGILSRTEDSKGLLEIFEPIKDDMQSYFGWMIGRRAFRLMHEGKENNFTKEEINELLKLAKGKEKLFNKVADEFSEFKSKILDVAEEAGLIDGVTRPAWDMADYIPFYRINEDIKSGPGNRKGLSHQTSGIKKLTGGEQTLGDPLENIIQNFSHLLDASMKNHALRLTLSNLVGSTIVENIPSIEYTSAIIPLAQIRTLLRESGMSKEDIKVIPKEALKGFSKMWAVRPPGEPDVIRVMDDGKAMYFKVKDPALLRGLTSVDMEPLSFIGMRQMRFFKRLLTGAITAEPTFMIRNFIRDSLHAWVINEDHFKVGIDSFRGIYKSMLEEGGMLDMMFAGGSFMGGHLNGNDPIATANSIRRALSSTGYTKTEQDGYLKTTLLTVEQVWTAYRSVGDAVENANREAVYEAAIKQGKSRAKGVFEAKDLMDFSMQGNFAMMRFFADTLPFFNARVQGMYKLGRAGAIPGFGLKKHILARGSLIMLASIALLMMNKDKDEYEELPDWDKDLNWHFWIGGEHFRIPKPFEIGLLFGTIPERFARNMLGKDDSSKTFERLMWSITDTMAFNPLPQIIRPGAEVYFNWNMFMDRPIEGMADEGKLKSARYNENTSSTMRLLGEGISDTINMSPKQMEHLWRGYLGTLGMYALGVVDLAVDALGGRATKPTRRMDEYPIIKAFYREDPAFSTKYQTELYEMRREAEMIQRTINAYLKSGEDEKAEALEEKHDAKLGERKYLNRQAKLISGIRKDIDIIYRDKEMSGDEKREAIDELIRERNLVAKEVVEETKPAFLLDKKRDNTSVPDSINLN